jgi:hypothetical protein
MRFSRKSPAVGSTKRHCPFEDLIETPVKARVAVSSTGLASAAAEGFSTTPARETEMTDAEAVVAGADGAAVVMAGADKGVVSTAAGLEAADVMTTAGEEGAETVTVTMTETVDAGGAAPQSLLSTAIAVAGVLKAAGELAASVVVAGVAGALAALSPKVND